MHKIQTEEYKGYNINIYYDEFPESPREWCNLGIMLCSHRNYTLGEEQLDSYLRTYHTGKDAILAYFQDKFNIIEDKEGYEIGLNEMTEQQITKLEKWIEDNIIMLPIYMYEHSGIALNTKGFTCQWDSGQVGIIYVTREQVKKEYKVKRITKKLKETVVKVLAGEVKTYGDYVEGSVYGYMIEDKNGDETGGCWGFYGYCFEENGLLNHAREEIEALIEEKKNITDNVACQVI